MGHGGGHEDDVLHPFVKLALPYIAGSVRLAVGVMGILNKLEITKDVKYISVISTLLKVFFYSCYDNEVHVSASGLVMYYCGILCLWVGGDVLEISTSYVQTEDYEGRTFDRIFTIVKCVTTTVFIMMIWIQKANYRESRMKLSTEHLFQLMARIEILLVVFIPCSFWIETVFEEARLLPPMPILETFVHDASLFIFFEILVMFYFQLNKWCDGLVILFWTYFFAAQLGLLFIYAGGEYNNEFEQAGLVLALLSEVCIYTIVYFSFADSKPNKIIIKPHGGHGDDQIVLPIDHNCNNAPENVVLHSHSSNR